MFSFCWAMFLYLFYSSEKPIIREEVEVGVAEADKKLFGCHFFYYIFFSPSLGDSLWWVCVPVQHPPLVNERMINMWSFTKVRRIKEAKFFNHFKWFPFTLPPHSSWLSGTTTTMTTLLWYAKLPFSLSNWIAVAGLLYFVSFDFLFALFGRLLWA